MKKVNLFTQAKIWPRTFLFLMLIMLFVVGCGGTSAPEAVVTDAVPAEPENTASDSDSEPEEANTEADAVAEVEVASEPEEDVEPEADATAEVEVAPDPTATPEPVPTDEPTPEPEPTEVPDEATFEPSLNFVSAADGFQFRNYSSRFPEGDLTIVEAQEMFGEVVCLRVEDGACIPHPKVSSWLDNMNETMHEVGHCTGFTVVSSQLHSSVRPISELGADMTFEVPRDVPVMQDIAQGYASYYSSNVWKQEVRDTPTAMLNVLMTLDDPVDIGIYYPEYGRNGHSILGHNVIDQGDGIFHIQVYDSNRPAEDNIIVINTNDDTWFYADAAINPDVASTDYKGDAETQSLTFIPISAYSEQLSCPADFAELCTADSGGLFSVVTLVGKGNALVNSAIGQIGQLGENLVNTISDARFLGVRGEYRSRQHPIMLIPDQEVLDVQFQATQADELLDLSISNPNFTISVKDILGQPGQIEQLTFDPATQQFTFVSGGYQRPAFVLTYTNGDQIYTTQMNNLAFEPGQQVTIRINQFDGDLEIASPGLFSTVAATMIARVSPAGSEVFPTVLNVPAGGVLAVDSDGWDGSDTMVQFVDNEGDGVYDVEETIERRPMSGVTGAYGNPHSFIDMLQLFTPYLDEAQEQDLINDLPTVGYLGPQLGRVYLMLPELIPEDIVGMFDTLALTLEQLGEFAIEANFDDEDKEVLLSILDLSPEEIEIATQSMADQELVEAAKDEWEFRNDLTGEDLTPFMEELGMTDAVQFDFVNEVDLPATDTQPLRQVVVSDAGAGACSVETEDLVQVSFVNRTNEPVVVNWVDYDCNEFTYRTLLPGQAYTQESFVGHPWRVRSLDGELMPLASGSSVSTTYIPGGGTIEILP